MAVLHEAARASSEAPIPAAAGAAARAAATSHAALSTIQLYATSLVLDTPLPPPGQVQVRTAVGDEHIPWECPPVNAPPTPLDSLCIRLLFTCLPIDDIVRVWGVLLAEGKVLLHAQHSALLWPVTHALMCMLAPLQWAHTTIPLLPPSLDLETFLDAPCPFLVGVTTGQLHSAGATLSQNRRAAWSSSQHQDSNKGGILAALRSPGGSRKAPGGGSKPPKHVSAVTPSNLPEDVTLVDLTGGAAHVPCDSGTAPVPAYLADQMLQVLQRSAAHLYAPTAASLLMHDLDAEIGSRTAGWGPAAAKALAPVAPEQPEAAGAFAGSTAAGSSSSSSGAAQDTTAGAAASDGKASGLETPAHTTAETVFHSTGKFKRRKTVNVFRDAMVSLIGDFDDFLVHDEHVKGGAGGLKFDHAAAIAARCDVGELYDQLVRSQAFAAFLSLRLSPAGALSPGVLWFDAVVDAAGGGEGGGADAAAALLGETDAPHVSAARAFLKDASFHVCRSVIVPAPLAASGGGGSVWRRQADAQAALQMHTPPPIGEMPSADELQLQLVRAVGVLDGDGTGDRRRSSLQHRRQSSGNTLAAWQAPVFQPIQEQDLKTRSWLSRVWGGSSKGTQPNDPPLTGFASPPLGKRSMVAHTPTAASMRKSRRNTARNINPDGVPGSTVPQAPTDSEPPKASSAEANISTKCAVSSPVSLVDFQAPAGARGKVQLLLADLEADMLCACSAVLSINTNIGHEQSSSSTGFVGASVEGGAGGLQGVASPTRRAAERSAGTWPVHRRNTSAVSQDGLPSAVLCFMCGQLQLKSEQGPPITFHGVQRLASDTLVSPVFQLDLQQEQTSKGLALLLRAHTHSPLSELLRRSVVVLPPPDTPAGAAMRQKPEAILKRSVSTAGVAWSPPLPFHISSAMRESVARDQAPPSDDSGTPPKTRRLGGSNGHSSPASPGSAEAQGRQAHLQQKATAAVQLVQQLYGAWVHNLTPDSSSCSQSLLTAASGVPPSPASLNNYIAPGTRVSLDLYRDLFVAYGAMRCPNAVLFLWEEFQAWQEQQLRAAKNMDELMGTRNSTSMDERAPLDSLASSGTLQSHWLTAATRDGMGPSGVLLSPTDTPARSSADRLSSDSVFAVPPPDVLLQPPPRHRGRARDNSAFQSSDSLTAMLDAIHGGRQSMGSTNADSIVRSRAGSSGSLASVMRQSSLVSQWMAQVRSVFCDTLTALLQCGVVADALRLLLHATGVSTDEMEPSAGGGVSGFVPPLPGSPAPRCTPGRAVLGSEKHKRTSALGPRHASSTAARKQLQGLKHRGRGYKRLQVQVDAPWLGLQVQPLSTNPELCRSVLDWERVFSVLEETKVTHADVGGSADSGSFSQFGTSKEPCDLVSLCDQVQSALAALTCIDTEQFGFDTNLGSVKAKQNTAPSFVVSPESDQTKLQLIGDHTKLQLIGAVVSGFSQPHGQPSPAQAAGLRAGDVILCVNHKECLREEHVRVLQCVTEKTPPLLFSVARPRLQRPAVYKSSTPLSPSTVLNVENGQQKRTSPRGTHNRGAKRERNSLPPARSSARSAPSRASGAEHGTRADTHDVVVATAARIGIQLKGGENLQCPSSDCGAEHTVSQAIGCMTAAHCTGPQREYTIPCRVCGHRFAARVHACVPAVGGDVPSADAQQGSWVLLLPVNTLLAAAAAGTWGTFGDLAAARTDVFWCIVLFLLDAGTPEVLKKVLGWQGRHSDRDRSSVLSCSTSGDDHLAAQQLAVRCRSESLESISSARPPPAPRNTSVVPPSCPYAQEHSSVSAIAALRLQCVQLRESLAHVEQQCVAPVWEAAQATLQSLQATREQLRQCEWRRQQSLVASARTRGGVAVVVRCRPPRTAETHIGGGINPSSPPLVSCMPGGRVLLDDGGTSAHGSVIRFDAALGTDSHQAGVYAHLEHISTAALYGMNGCILAYGQTGSGKTHTMQGPGSLGGHSAPKDGSVFQVQDSCLAEDATAAHHGVLQRVLASVFGGARLENHVQGGNVVLGVTMSAVEIHNDTFVDLLPPDEGGQGGGIPAKVSIQRSTGADGAVSIHLRGASCMPVDCMQTGLDLLHAASDSRRVASNGVHAGSSRSHLCIVLQVRVTRRDGGSGKDSTAAAAKLVICDLAGSERLGATKLHEAAAGVGALSGAFGSPTPKQAAATERLKEAQSINGSLTALGNVVSALSKGASSAKEGGGPARHIPYRDSKLTSLLQDCLGGSARCAFVIAVSPDAQDADETRSTLAFAARLKHIKASAAKANTHRSASEQLKVALAAAKSAQGECSAAAAACQKWQRRAEAAEAALANRASRDSVDSADSAGSTGSRGTKRNRGGSWQSQGGGGGGGQSVSAATAAAKPAPAVSLPPRQQDAATAPATPIAGASTPKRPRGLPTAARYDMNGRRIR